MSKIDIPLERRRRKGRWSQTVERAVFCGLIGLLGGVVVLLGGPAWLSSRSSQQSEPTPQERAENARRFEREMLEACDLKMGELRSQLKKSQEDLEALKNKPVPADEEGRRKHEEEKKALEKKNADLETRIHNLEESKKNVEKEVANNSPPTNQGSSGDASKTNVDVPQPKKPDAPSKGGPQGDPNSGTGKDSGGGLGGAAAAAAVLAAMKFPGLIPILIALGIGGDLFGTKHKDGQKIVEQVQKVFEDGAELKVEAAVNKIAAEHWNDPTDAIAQIRSVLSHPEMVKRLGPAKAKELADRLDELEKLFDSHSAILRLVGREATLRLLRELPPILVAEGGPGQASARAKWHALMKPYSGLDVQAEVWKRDVLDGYITAALSGKALSQSAAGLRPFKIAETAYIKSLRDMLKHPQGTPGKPTKPSKPVQV